MQRRQHSREFKLEAVRLIKERGVSVAQASRDLNVQMNRSGNYRDNAAMASFFSSLKTGRVGRKVYRSRDEARADVFDYVECFYNPNRQHSTIGYKSPIDFECEADVV